MASNFLKGLSDNNPTKSSSFLQSMAEMSRKRIDERFGPEVYGGSMSKPVVSPKFTSGFAAGNPPLSDITKPLKFAASNAPLPQITAPTIPVTPKPGKTDTQQISIFANPEAKADYYSDRDKPRVGAVELSPAPASDLQAMEDEKNRLRKRWLELASKEVLTEEEKKEAKEAVAYLRGGSYLEQRWEAIQNLTEVPTEQDHRDKALADLLESKYKATTAFAAGLVESAPFAGDSFSSLYDAAYEGMPQLNPYYDPETGEASQTPNVYESALTAQPVAAGVGEVIGNIAQLVGGEAAVKAGTSLIKGFSKLSPILQRTIISGLTFGAKGAIDTASEGGSTGNIALSFGLGAVSGAAGSATSSALSKLGTKILTRYGLQNRWLPVSILNGLSSTGFAAVNQGVGIGSGYVLDPSYKIDPETLVKDLITAFGFGFISSTINTIRVSGANKANMRKLNEAIATKYANLMMNAGNMTPEQVINTQNDLLIQINFFKKYLSAQQVVGAQKEINEIQRFLNMMNDNILSAQAMANANTITGNVAPNVTDVVPVGQAPSSVPPVVSAAPITPAPVAPTAPIVPTAPATPPTPTSTNIHPTPVAPAPQDVSSTIEPVSEAVQAPQTSPVPDQQTTRPGTEGAESGTPATSLGPNIEAGKFSATLYRGSGKSAAEIYANTQYPVAGKGTYYAFTEEAAKNYGDKIESADISLNNPLVIRDDVEWRDLTKKAGWPYPNIFGASDKEVIRLSDALREVVINSGHDGLVIQFEADWKGDINEKTGNAVKSLSNVFGHDQVVVYDQSVETAGINVPATSPVAEAPPQSAPAQTPASAPAGYGRAGKSAFTKWAANEWVNANLSNLDDPYVQAYSRFFKKWYDAGRQGIREIDVPKNADDLEFPPFLQTEAYNAGKKDASTSVDKGNTAGTGKTGHSLDAISPRLKALFDAAKKGKERFFTFSFDGNDYAGFTGIFIKITDSKVLAAIKQNYSVETLVNENTKNRVGKEFEADTNLLKGQPYILPDIGYVFEQGDDQLVLNKKYVDFFDGNEFYINTLKDTYIVRVADGNGNTVGGFAKVNKTGVDTSKLNTADLKSFREEIIEKPIEKSEGKEDNVNEAINAEEGATADGHGTVGERRDDIRGGSVGAGGLSETGEVGKEGPNPPRSSGSGEDLLPSGGGTSEGDEPGGDGQINRDGDGKGPLAGSDEGSTQTTDADGHSKLPKSVRVGNLNKNNYRITEDIDSKRPNFNDNYEAIKLVKTLEAEGRAATKEELAILSRYKGWGGLKNEVLGWRASTLRSVMTEEEYQTARDSILNAYYTSTKIISGIYKAVMRMGFTGGAILEPSMGVGNFFGMLPSKLSASSALHGVELDSITGQIAKHLYPDAKIDIAGFQDVLYPDGTFDLVVGNVPFSNDIRIPYRGDKFNLHDFFFVKSLDETKSGGILALITSTGTLDKISGKTQAAIAKKANLIAAFRLPDNAFKTNAGTSVTTDLIFLQKKGGDIEDNGVSFARIGRIDGIPINEYYVDHPNNILGELAYEKDMYGSDRVVVHAVDNFEQLFNKAMLSLPKGLLTGEPLQTPPTKVGSKRRDVRSRTTFRVTDDGVAIADTDGNIQKVPYTKNSVDIIKGFLEIKRAYFSLIDAERSGNLDAANEFRDAMNNAYDKFAKKYGSIASNRKILSRDDDYIRVSGLETIAEKGVVEKSAIFTRPTAYRGKMKSAGSSDEALTISLNEDGKINLDHMVELTGTSKEQIVSDLAGEIIMTPDGEYVLTAQYLSGNIYEKLEAVKGKAGFEKQEALLTAAIPVPKTADAIDADFGSHWIPPKYINDFLRITFSLGVSPKVEYSKELGKWDLPSFYTQIKKYSTKRVDATKVVVSTLNNKNITVYDTYEDGTKILNRQDTEAAQQKQYDLRDAFRKWIFSEDARRKDLEGIFNRSLNAYAPMNCKSLSERIDFGISPDSKIKLRDYQKEAAARIVYVGNTLLHHGVGTGKTATMIAAAHVMKRSGIANKPMFVVPNGKVNDFRNEIIGMYPDANVLALDDKSMLPAEIQRTKSAIATGDLDYVIIYRTAFQKIAVSPETEAAFIQAQLDDLDRAIRESAGDENGKSRFETNLIARKKTLEEKLKAVLSKPKDETIWFEDTGVDALFIDEAHNFKKVGFATTHSISGIDSSTNQITTDLYMKENYIRNRGGRIILATATPLTNTLSEMYNMTMHVNPDVLRQSGIYSFDGWLNTFADIQSQPEIAPDGKSWRIKERVRGFKSGNELIGLYRQFADVKQTKDVVKDLPKAEYIDVVCEGTEIHQELLDSFAERSGNVKPGKDNMLLISSDGRAAGTDLRLLTTILQDMHPGITNEELDLPTSKINKCVKNVISEYNKHEANKGTQFIFLDLGVRDGGSRYAFNLYDDLINKLVEGGIPRKEIANIQDYDGEVKRSALYEAMNSGAIRILLGSTSKMGEGVNAQNKAVALHHLSVPYRPDNLEQREGRVIRHGNENKDVRIYRYIQEKSFDSYLWQMIERKAAYVAQALNGGDATDLEENSEAILNAREAKALATGNPLIMEKVGLQDKVSKLRMLQRSFYAEQRDAAQRVVLTRTRLQELNAELKGAIKDAAIVAKSKPDKFSIKIGSVVYSVRKEAAEALSKAMADRKIKTIGEIYGLTIERVAGESDLLQLRGSNTYKVEVGDSPDGNITRLVNVATKNVVNGEARIKRIIASTETGLKDAEATTKLTFHQQEELDAAVARQREVDRELGVVKDEVKFDDVAMPESYGDIDENEARYSLRTDPDIQNISSSGTSINSSKLPVLFSKVDFKAGTVNLDIGGGRFDNVTEYLEKQGVTNYIFDPYNRSEEHNKAVAAATEEGQSDTVTISNVLNVIQEAEARELVLLNAIDALKPNGTVYITIYEGDGSGIGKQTTKGYQLNRKTADYKEEIERLFNDVTIKNGVIIARLPKNADAVPSTKPNAKYSTSPREWPDPTSTPSQKPILNLTNLINKIRHDFSIPISTGNIRKRNASGVYIQKPETIRIKVTNDLPTIAHELGHHFDKHYKLSSEASATVKQELANNLDPSFAKLYKSEKLPGEGVAEFVRRYLSDREQTEKDYPLFYVDFARKVSNEELQLLDSLADEVNSYLTADLSAISNAAVSMPGDRKDFRSVGEKVADKGDALYQAMVDALHGIHRFADFVDNRKPYILATNSTRADSRASSIIQYGMTDMHGQKVGLGLRQVLQGVNVKNINEFRDFGEYLIVVHGPERLKEGLRVFADSRINNVEYMNERKNELETKYPAFKDAAERLYTFQQQLLQLWAVETGIIPAATADKWLKRWAHYVPFNRDMSDKISPRNAKVRRAFANQKNPFKKARGSGRDIINPVESIARNTVKLVQAAIRNNVMQAITNTAAITEGAGAFLEKVPSPISATTYDARGLKENVKQKLFEALGNFGNDDVVDAAFEVINTAVDDILVQFGRGKAFGETVTVLKDGKPEFWMINDPLLFESVANMNPVRMSGLLEAYGRITRFMTGNITGNNIIWALFSNMPRDLMTFYTYSNNKNPVKIIGNIVNGYLQKAKTSIGSQKIDPLYLEFLAMGGDGKNSFLTAHRDMGARSLDKLLHSNMTSNMSIPAPLRKTFDALKHNNPLEWIETISDMIEGGPRFAYYKMRRQAGATTDEAMYDAMEITVNFQRGGIKAREIGKVVQFFNAGVQGIDRFFRYFSAEDVPREHRKKVIFARWGMYLAAGAILALLQILAAQYQDKKGYEQLSAYQKNNFWNIPLGNFNFFAIPKPRELAALSSTFERALETLLLDNPDAFKHYEEYLIEQFMPPVMAGAAQAIYSYATQDTSGQKAGIASMLNDLGILGTVIGMTSNMDFRGNPIVNQGLAGLVPKAQFDARTSKISVAIGEALNLSPKMLDYFFNATLGGYWKVVRAVSSVDSSETDWSMGVANTYLKDSRYSTDVINDFYDAKDDMERLKKTYPDNAEYKIAANDYADLATFYSRYNKLSRLEPDSPATLAVRQTVIEMIEQFSNEQEIGQSTDIKYKLDMLAASLMDTRFYPQVMDEVLVLGEGSDKKTYELTASQYVDYQTTYLGFYWETVGKALDRNYSSDEAAAKAVRAAKERALELTKKYMKKKLGV